MKEKRRCVRQSSIWRRIILENCGLRIAQLRSFEEACRIIGRVAQLHDAEKTHVAAICERPPTECRIITTFPGESSRAMRVVVATSQRVHLTTKAAFQGKIDATEVCVFRC